MDFRYRILDAGCSMLARAKRGSRFIGNTGFKILDIGCWILDVRSSVFEMIHPITKNQYLTSNIIFRRPVMTVI